MKKIFAFDERVINGTVTASSSTVCFVTRELAEKARSAAIDANRVPDELGIRYCCGDIKETTIYESEDEVPILNNSKKESHHQVRFRGKDRKNKEWLYGFYLQNRGAHFVCPDEFAHGKSWDDYEIDPDTLGQFTGQTDKNGKEIYEGDIAVFDESDKRYIIEWHYDIGIIGRQVGTDNLISIYTWLGATTAIGNIYDNPELLKKTTD